ncbi:uncharacterized protein [Dermacentor albipictus]|uniref:uncharacterized protein isoform X2 n=1 Tax=Dermacentor albipictus TaxID=60249 RepID=UPI0038FD256C
MQGFAANAEQKRGAPGWGPKSVKDSGWDGLHQLRRRPPDQIEQLTARSATLSGTGEHPPHPVKTVSDGWQQWYTHPSYGFSRMVKDFILEKLACTKGTVRGVDPSCSPQEVLEDFQEADAGIVPVYCCHWVVDGIRVPAESIIATFAGTPFPTDLKACTEEW